MLRLRLQRVGRRNDPSFRMVITEKTNSTKSGKFLEIVGSYDPRKDTKSIDKERIVYWMSKGAKATGTVHNILVDEGVINEKKINVLPKKRPVVKEVTEEKKEESVAPATSEEPVKESLESKESEATPESA